MPCVTTSTPLPNVTPLVLLPSILLHIGCNSHPRRVCHGACWHHGPLILPGVWKSLLPSSWSPGWITAWLESKGIAWDTDLQENIKKMTRVIAAPWSPPHTLGFTIPTLGNVTLLERCRVHIQGGSMQIKTRGCTRASPGVSINQVPGFLKGPPLL